jgi:catechol 2,3-dioxygenase-like lactoylglutathione lyase family enzyme
VLRLQAWLQVEHDLIMISSLLHSLRSVDFGVPDLEAAEKFFTDIWRLQVVDRYLGSVYLRGTGRDHHLLALHSSEKPILVSLSLRASSSEALDRISYTVSAHGGTLLQARAPVREPGGGEAVLVRDPQGRILRILWGDAQGTEVLNLPDSPIRLAHAVLNSHNVAEGLTFYESVFGMRLSDRTRIMAFIRIPREPRGDHHSLALADADNDCLNHVAFVMPDVEAVMRGGGRMKDAGYPIEWGPGRHGPGNNSFNYFIGPAGFVIEYTADVEQVDHNYPVRGPQDWKWPEGRYDQWGISAPPSPRLKDAQRQINFERWPKASIS